MFCDVFKSTGKVYHMFCDMFKSTGKKVGA